MTESPTILTFLGFEATLHHEDGGWWGQGVRLGLPDMVKDSPPVDRKNTALVQANQAYLIENRVIDKIKDILRVGDFPDVHWECGMFYPSRNHREQNQQPSDVFFQAIIEATKALDSEYPQGWQGIREECMHDIQRSNWQAEQEGIRKAESRVRPLEGVVARWVTEQGIRTRPAQLQALHRLLLDWSQSLPPDLQRAMDDYAARLEKGRQ